MRRTRRGTRTACRRVAVVTNLMNIERERKSDVPWWMVDSLLHLLKMFHVLTKHISFVVFHLSNGRRYIFRPGPRESLERVVPCGWFLSREKRTQKRPHLTPVQGTSPISILHAKKIRIDGRGRGSMIEGGRRVHSKHTFFGARSAPIIFLCPHVHLIQHIQYYLKLLFVS